MKVICAGFWKTGTKSLAAALRILGYKVYDYDSQLFDLEDLWTKFFNGTVTDDDIRKSLESIDVLIDGPVIAFWEEIHRVFPDAKVILTTRDEDSWFKSYRGMVDQGFVRYFFWVFLFVSFCTPAGRRFFRNAMGVAEFCLATEGPFTLSLMTVPKSPRLCKLKYRKHNCYVKYIVPKNKLLEHRSSDGWIPLCKFLDKGVSPDIPYPYKNKLNALFKNEGFASHPGFQRLIKQALIVLVVIIILLFYAVYHFTI